MISSDLKTHSSPNGAVCKTFLRVAEVVYQLINITHLWILVQIIADLSNLNLSKITSTYIMH